MINCYYVVKEVIGKQSKIEKRSYFTVNASVSTKTYLTIKFALTHSSLAGVVEYYKRSKKKVDVLRSGDLAEHTTVYKIAPSGYRDSAI